MTDDIKQTINDGVAKLHEGNREVHRQLRDHKWLVVAGFVVVFAGLAAIGVLTGK